LQAFPAANGWPFPEYIGACGRVVVEEYIGTTLMDTVSLMSWEEKVELNERMLENISPTFYIPLIYITSQTC